MLKPVGSLALTSIVAVLLAPTGKGQCPLLRVENPYATPGHGFGANVRIEGTTAAVSGRSIDWRGAAFIYERTGSGWIQTQEVGCGNMPSGTFPVPELDGNTLLLSNSYLDRVRAFERVAGVFQPIMQLEPSDASLSAGFGQALSLDGDRVAIGAPLDRTHEDNGGAVYVFERSGTTWTETVRIDPPFLDRFGFFGKSVALEDDLLVIGQPGYSSAGTFESRAFVYRLVGSTWSLEQIINPQREGFGYSLDLDQGRIAIGAYRDQSSPDNGSVSIYELSGGSWQVASLLGATAPMPAPGFGAKLDLHGDRLIVGSLVAWGGLEQVHLFTETPAGWTTTSILGAIVPDGWNPNGTHFGYSVSLGDNDLWIGAWGEGTTPFLGHQGAAYAYDLVDRSESYCGPAVPNSTGQSAALQVAGCSTLFGNNLDLLASRMPLNQLGIFLVSRTSGMSPFGGSSQGLLCLSAPLGRFVSQAASTGPSGTLELQVDLTSLPVGILGAAAMPGESWYFQAWFRDANPGSTSNTTQGISVFVQ